MHAFTVDRSVLAKEKNRLLRQWISCGMNLQACESRIRISKEQALKGKKVWAQIPVKAMSLPPHNFSETLGAFISTLILHEGLIVSSSSLLCESMCVTRMIL